MKNPQIEEMLLDVIIPMEVPDTCRYLGLRFTGQKESQSKLTQALGLGFTWQMKLFIGITEVYPLKVKKPRGQYLQLYYPLQIVTKNKNECALEIIHVVMTIMRFFPV